MPKNPHFIERTIGSIRYYNAKKQQYDDSESLTVRVRASAVNGVDSASTTMIPRRPNNWCRELKRGGTLQFLPGLVSTRDCLQLKNAMDDQNAVPLRQYTFQKWHDEPRLQLLLSSTVMTDVDNHSMMEGNKPNQTSIPQPGYQYHGVRMKGHNMCNVPELVSLADKLKDALKVKQWNIGVQAILYRDHRDNMGYHADDTQGETKIVTLVIASPDPPREVHFRTKVPAGSCYCNGDEFIVLSPGVGDVYVMDAEMQKCYEHTVPKSCGSSIQQKKNHEKNDDNSQSMALDEKRYVLVFRDGNQVMVAEDSGVLATSRAPRPERANLHFGAIANLVEGRTYLRNEMFQMKSHEANQKGVNGNVVEGCNSIVISRRDGIRNDKGSRFTYLATTKQGARALITSCQKEKEIRVFRSSAGANKYAPKHPGALIRNSKTRKSKLWARKKTNTITKVKRTLTAIYRYEGLFKIVGVHDSNGKTISSNFPVQKLPASETDMYGLQFVKVKTVPPMNQKFRKQSH